MSTSFIQVKWHTGTKNCTNLKPASTSEILVHTALLCVQTHSIMLLGIMFRKGIGRKDVCNTVTLLLQYQTTNVATCSSDSSRNIPKWVICGNVILGAVAVYLSSVYGRNSPTSPWQKKKPKFLN